MIKPQELLEISIKNSSDRIEKCLTEIQERIFNAANRGEFSYLCNGNKYPSGLLHYVTKNLTQLGYKVEYTNSMLEISWYDAEIKQTVPVEEKKTEVNKPNKSVQKSERTAKVGENSSISSSSSK